MHKQSLLFLSLAILLLGSCGLNGSSASSEGSSAGFSSEEVSSSVSSPVSSSAETSSSAACDSTDYVSQIHLALAYEGKNFLTDGIARVALKENVDGDTTHFYALNTDGTPNKSVIIKSRYLCIDTPESTGQIQPWGKAASEFTASQINAAKTIVISSNATTYGNAVADSTGERYLSYVWVSEEANAPLSSLRLLNLLIVQNGYSATKAAGDSIYKDAFYAADAEAQCLKLVIWSGQDDPDYIYTTGVTTTLQLIDEGKIYDEEVGDYVSYDWTDSTHNKVAFDCYVAMTVSGNAYVYMDYPDLDDPLTTNRYGMYIFSGYRNISPLTKVGWKLNVVGNCTTFNGNLQVTNVNYNPIYHTDDDITVLDKTGSTYVPPETSTPVSKAYSDAYMNVVIQVNNLHGVADYGTYADSDGKAFTVHCLDEGGASIYLRFSLGTVTDRNNIAITINADNFIAYFCKAGETFNVFAPVNRYISGSGNTTYQLALCHNKDLVFNS